MTPVHETPIGRSSRGSDGSLTRRLTRMVRAREVTDTDRAEAARYVLDWLGSYVAGQAAATGRILAAYGRDGGDLERRVFLASARSHVTETDDLHRASVTHPGCVVIPAALLLGSERGLRGHAVLRAVLVGYEVMLRVGESLGPAHYRIFHNTATAGVFGSAGAAAFLLDLDEDGWVWALGNAGTQAAGLWQFNVEGAMTKPLHTGHAAAAGLRSALLAAEGFTGPEEILEGGKGLFQALCPDGDPAAVLAADAGWKLPETSMKPYPCCRHVHPAIDAALELREKLGARADSQPRAGTKGRAAPDGPEIAAIRVETYPAALNVTDRPRPTTPEEARFSLQYAVARTLACGRPGLEAFEPSAIDDPAIRELLKRVGVESDPGLAGAYPERWGAAVDVEMADGVVHRAERASAKGDPECPLDAEELDAKVRGLMAWAGMDAGQVAAVLDDIGGMVADGAIGALPLVGDGAFENRG